MKGESNRKSTGMKNREKQSSGRACPGHLGAKDALQAIINLPKDAAVKLGGARTLGEIGKKAADAMPALQEFK